MFNSGFIGATKIGIEGELSPMSPMRAGAPLLRLALAASASLAATAPRSTTLVNFGRGREQRRIKTNSAVDLINRAPAPSRAKQFGVLAATIATVNNAGTIAGTNLTAGRSSPPPSTSPATPAPSRADLIGIDFTTVANVANAGTISGGSFGIASFGPTGGNINVTSNTGTITGGRLGCRGTAVRYREQRRPDPGRRGRCGHRGQHRYREQCGFRHHLGWDNWHQRSYPRDGRQCRRHLGDGYEWRRHQRGVRGCDQQGHRRHPGCDQRHRHYRACNRAQRRCHRRDAFGIAAVAAGSTSPIPGPSIRTTLVFHPPSSASIIPAPSPAAPGRSARTVSISSIRAPCLAANPPLPVTAPGSSIPALSWEAASE